MPARFHCLLGCMVGLIVYWATLPTVGLHGLLAGYIAYWNSVHVPYYWWVALSNVLHGLLLGYME